jgi:hypothetical protein
VVAPGGSARARGRLTEAEKAITSAVDHIGALASVAQLYAERASRLAAGGDAAGAAEARAKARQWIDRYAPRRRAAARGPRCRCSATRFLAEHGLGEGTGER